MRDIHRVQVHDVRSPWTASTRSSFPRNTHRTQEVCKGYIIILTISIAIVCHLFIYLSNFFSFSARYLLSALLYRGAPLAWETFCPRDGLHRFPWNTARNHAAALTAAGIDIHPRAPGRLLHGGKYTHTHLHVGAHT